MNKYASNAIKDGGSSYTPPVKKILQSQKGTVVKAVIKADDPSAETSPQSKASNKTPSIEESPDSDDDDPDIPEVDASIVMSPLELLIKHKNQFIKSQVIMKDRPVITDDKNDDTQSVTGNIETENVGTEVGINGDSNTGNAANDIISEINYYGLYNDLFEGAGVEMYSRAGNTFLKTVNSLSNASSRLVKEMYNGTIKSGAQHAGDAFDTVLKALDDLDTITKVLD